MVHSKFRAKGMPNGLSFVSLPYKRCSLKYSSLIFFITISYCHYSPLPRVTNLFKENYGSYVLMPVRTLGRTR